MPFPEAGEGLMSKAITWIKALHLILFQWLQYGQGESVSDVQDLNIDSRAESAWVKSAEVPELVTQWSPVFLNNASSECNSY